MHGQSLPPTSGAGARKRIMELEYQDRACLRLQGNFKLKGPQADTKAAYY